MVNVFIPSYNRPMQLDALLRSIERYDVAKLIKPENVYVRYQGINKEYDKGYEILKERFSSYNIAPKTGLYSDMMEIMSMYSRYFLIITDDSLFYRDFCLTDHHLDSIFTSNTNHFSFRLGFNTTLVDYTNPNSDSNLYEPTILGNNIVLFNWTHNSNHYGYPCALDGTLFEQEHILKATKESGWDSDYRAWECRLHTYLKSNPTKTYGCCFITSALVNIPCNMVSDGPYCRNGEIYKYTIEELNSMYLDGKQININIDPFLINSVQQEIKLEFQPYNI